MEKNVEPLTDVDLAAMKKAAQDAAPSGRWYVVESPWLPAGCETYIIGGHHDPHVGRMVCDFQDAAMAGVENEWSDEEWTARNWANAAHIAESNPLAVLDLIARLESAEQENKRLREALTNLLADAEYPRRSQSHIDAARAALQPPAIEP